MQESFSLVITLHEVNFNVSRVPGQSGARANSKSHAIYESPRHSAYLSTFENAKLGDFLPANSIAGKFLPTDLPNWGDNLKIYPNFALFSTLGDELRPRLCSGEQIK